MPRRRTRSHWGTLIELSPGRKYGIRWVEDTPDGRRKRYETFIGTRRQAEDRKDEIHAEIMTREAARGGSPTVGYAYESWYLPAAGRRVEAGKLKDRTVEQYKDEWARDVGPRWADVPVTEVRPVDVESWLHTLTRSTGVVAKAVLSNVMNECVKRGVVQANPMRVRMVESPLGGEMDKGIWTLEELDEIAWRTRGERVSMSLLLMAFGSCRPGESLGPRLDEVRREECGGMTFAAVEVRRQMLRGGLTEVGDMKNPHSARTAYVPEPWCWPVLHRASHGGPLEEYLSDAGDGEPLSQDAARRSWNAAFRKGGPADGFERHPWKNLRPAWETWMNWRNHVPREKIEKIIGHTGRGVTAVYYDRPLGVQLMEEVAGSFKRYPFESPHPWREEYGF